MFFTNCHENVWKTFVDIVRNHFNACPEKNSRLADDGLNFLLLLVDVQVLFDAALGLYDFDLVIKLIT